jgi:xylulokinase
VVDEPEATALGAALLGGVGAGVWPNLDSALAALDRRVHVVAPDIALVESYRRVRETVFDRLQSALRPFNQELIKIADGSLLAKAPR